MSVSGSPIECRNCKEIIDMEEESCPHCGTSLRNNLYIGGAMVLGGIVAAMSLFDPASLYFFGIIGGIILLAGIVLLYDKRQRISRGKGREGEGQVAEETERDPF